MKSNLHAVPDLEYARLPLALRQRPTRSPGPLACLGRRVAKQSSTRGQHQAQQPMHCQTRLPMQWPVSIQYCSDSLRLIAMPPSALDAREQLQAPRDQPNPRYCTEQGRAHECMPEGGADKDGRTASLLVLSTYGNLTLRV